MIFAAIGFLFMTGGTIAAPNPLPTVCVPIPVINPACPSPSPRSSPRPGHKPSPQPPPAPSSSGGPAIPGIGSAYASPTPPGPQASPSPAVDSRPPGAGGGPPVYLQIFPADSNSAGSAAEVYLLCGLLLITVGVGLIAIRHRRDALQLAALERNKTDFLNLASHELRGPLTILKGYLSIAADGAMGKLPPRLAAAMPTLESKVGEMEVLVDQMVEAARLEAGKPALKLSDGDLRDVVRQAVPFSLWDAGASEFHLDLPAQPVIARLDDYRLRTLISHLFDNAIKYSPDRLHVTARLTVEGAKAVLRISDRGVGISPENMSRLFTRFGRIPNERTTGIRGLGLGLYLSRQVAQLHGGDLSAESRLGEGTTFVLSLPLAEIEPVRGGARSPKPA